MAFTSWACQEARQTATSPRATQFFELGPQMTRRGLVVTHQDIKTSRHQHNKTHQDNNERSQTVLSFFSSFHNFWPSQRFPRIVNRRKVGKKNVFFSCDLLWLYRGDTSKPRIKFEVPTRKMSGAWRYFCFEALLLWEERAQFRGDETCTKNSVVMLCASIQVRKVGQQR